MTDLVALPSVLGVAAVRDVVTMPPLLGVALVGCVLLIGAYATVVLDTVAYAVVAGHRVAVGSALLRPLREAALLVRRQVVTTEAPDRILWVLAPAAYAGLAVAALATVPLAPGAAVTDVRTGIVVFGAAEALAIVAVFLHGWAPNSPFARRLRRRQHGRVRCRGRAARPHPHR